MTALSYLEAPPPAEDSSGDPVATLYTENCAACHGASISVPDGLDLHQVIAQGTHQGMPAWAGDLDTDEIDALAGFITSPRGNELYNQYCLECHQISDLVASNQIELRDSLDQGQDYLAHAGVGIPTWRDALSSEEINDLLNFLVAPDGQRLFSINCSSCHGTTVAFARGESELMEIISQGGLHLEMPSWQGKLSPSEIDQLANYVLDPETNLETQNLFADNCSACHGTRIPVSGSVDAARESITIGGSHETMPVWGDVLTESQLTALTNYTWQAVQGAPLEVGQDLYGEYCAFCHGTFGEGGKNPARPDDIIAAISSAEYLNTRENLTLFNIISQGQPNFGMSPFSSDYGGLLNEDQIDSIISYIRTWEDNPPVDLPPEISRLQDELLGGQEIYDAVCTQCHREDDQAIALNLADPEFQSRADDLVILETIRNGRPSTPMIAFGRLFNDEQIQELVLVIRNLESSSNGSSPDVSEVPSFTMDLVPILEKDCLICHGTLGGWDGSSYDLVLNSGDNGPAVIPGDAQNSLLVQKLQDTQTQGGVMPPGGKLGDNLIQLFINWINAGAPNN